MLAGGRGLDKGVQREPRSPLGQGWRMGVVVVLCSLSAGLGDSGWAFDVRGNSLASVTLLALLFSEAKPVKATEADGARLTLYSTAFRQDGLIPSRHSCNGQDVSPPLSWGGVPALTQSLVLIVDDPDAADPAAPRAGWVHWVVYNIPPSRYGLPEAADPTAYPSGALAGLNDWQRTGYGGPCPLLGKHRYVYRLYALDAVLPDLKHPAKAMLEKAMKGHVLAQTQLTGVYRRR